MNQDQLKSLMLQLEPDVDDFTITFSGKASEKVNGLYYPDRREIIIHNKNFADDNRMVYTAIHEFAHHIHFTKSTVPVTTRSHTTFFWSTFHSLLKLAEEKNIYHNIFTQDQRFIELTKKIKDGFLTENGRLMKEFGALLIEAMQLCQEVNANFEDYFDRVLGLHRTTAKTIMQIHSMDLNPAIGFENMKTLARIKDPEERKIAETAFIEGDSPDMVKSGFFDSRPPVKKDEIERLTEEKERIELNLEKLTVQLAKIERKIQDLKYDR
jgi:hypothetical protein